MKNKKFQKFLKNQLDFWIALFLFIIFSPVFLMIVLLVKIILKGPVFFLQKRPGKSAELFTIIKFRTMEENSEELGLNLEENNPRLTNIGKFLRRWHLDEIPQLINIILGQMSFVGPRPPMIFQTNPKSEFENQRFLMKPGLTGWAQLNGGNIFSWEERVKYDLWYIENWSLWLDFKIFILSFFKIILFGQYLYKK